MLFYLQESYSQIVITIIPLDVLKCGPVAPAVQVILQLLRVGQLHVTKVTAGGVAMRKNIMIFNVTQQNHFFI